MEPNVLPENKNVNNKIKTYEQLPNDFSISAGATDIRGINEDSYVKAIRPLEKEDKSDHDIMNFGIERSVLIPNTSIKKDDWDMRAMPTAGWAPDLPPRRGLRDFAVENDLIVKPSTLDGRSSGILSESTPTYGYIRDSSEGLTWNPNSAKNTVMEGLPRGGVSTRF